MQGTTGSTECVDGFRRVYYLGKRYIHGWHNQLHVVQAEQGLGRLDGYRVDIFGKPTDDHLVTMR